jgi:hypothetical protein
VGAETLVFMICFDEVGFSMTTFLREFISHTVGFFFCVGSLAGRDVFLCGIFWFIGVLGKRRWECFFGEVSTVLCVKRNWK